MSRPTQLAKLANPTGRLDWLASQLLAEWVKQRPTLAQLHTEFRNEIDGLIHNALGPHHRECRKIAAMVRNGVRIARTVGRPRV
jgi:hypothetical protein